MPKKTTNSKATIASKAEPKSKAIKKESAPAKVEAAKKAVVKKEQEKADKALKYLDLGLLLDCTGSMYSWIQRAKDTLIQIIDNVKESCDGKLKVRVSFIGYRDHCDTNRFSIKGFTENLQDMKNFIQKVPANGGGDCPEDITGGMRKCLDQAWNSASKKQVFHIADAPCHGKKYHKDEWDSYPAGCPEGLVLEDLMGEFAAKDIAFTFIKLDENCNKMIPIMQKHHPKMQVTDLVSATKNKSSAEVTKMFVDSASFILRATVGGKGKAAAAKRKAASGGEALWDVKQLETGQNFSCISYLHVDNIEGDKITVKNHLGGAWFISKDLLVRDCWSADHFEQEVKCSMTELSGLMDCCRDTIFKVAFKKKIEQSHVEDVLMSMKMADLKSDAKLKPIIKGMIEGDSCEITGHLVDVDNNLGRSVVVDLNAKAPNNIR